MRIPPLPFAAANGGGPQGWVWKLTLQDEGRETDEVFRALPEKKDETGMKLTKNEWLRGAGRWLGIGVCLLGMAMGSAASAQAVSTTTVQGTVYLANGQAGIGTLVVSWPAFTTANGLAVAADSTTVAIAPDGFVSVNLAPNLGATPAGLYYTAVYYLSDGNTNTQYRRRDAAELLRVLNGIVHQPAAGVLSGDFLVAVGGWSPVDADDE